MAVNENYNNEKNICQVLSDAMPLLETEDSKTIENKIKQELLENQTFYQKYLHFAKDDITTSKTKKEKWTQICQNMDPSNPQNHSAFVLIFTKIYKKVVNIFINQTKYYFGMSMCDELLFLYKLRVLNEEKQQINLIFTRAYEFIPLLTVNEVFPNFFIYFYFFIFF